MIQILENHITTKNREPPYKNGGSRQIQVLSEWRDLNPRPPAPKAGALTGLRYTPWGERWDLNPRPPGPQPGALTS